MVLIANEKLENVTWEINKIKRRINFEKHNDFKFLNFALQNLSNTFASYYLVQLHLQLVASEWTAN